MIYSITFFTMLSAYLISNEFTIEQMSDPLLVIVGLILSFFSGVFFNFAVMSIYAIVFGSEDVSSKKK